VRKSGRADCGRRGKNKQKFLVTGLAKNVEVMERIERECRTLIIPDYRKRTKNPRRKNETIRGKPATLGSLRHV